MSQPNAIFLGVHTQGTMTPNSNSAEIYVQCTYRQVLSSYVYSFGNYHVDKQTYIQRS